jgi:hypothetical protein
MDLKRRVWRAEDFLGVRHVPRRATVLAWFEVGHLAKSFPNLFEVLWHGLNALHDSSRWRKRDGRIAGQFVAMPERIDSGPRVVLP